MKKFALFLPNTEGAQIVEGLSATITKKSDGLKVVINLPNKKRITFSGVIIFCELSNAIKML